mgnify:CR=1 FL=1|jgi:hypothetical protein
MSYKLKTLIVFDTNSLHSTEAGEVAYSFFAFGRPFQVIENFIHENKLSEDIHIAIPTWAIEELKDQKQRQYKEDIEKFRKLVTRLTGMPHIQEIEIPDANYDISNYIQQKADEFLGSKRIKLMGIPEALANTVLQNMMQRVMKEERSKHPFVHAKKGTKTYKDAGFKDNLIWESLLHFPELEKYDKVIFLTGDSDYTNCKEEFTKKWNKHFTLVTDENNAIAEIQKDYELYITERDIYEFTQTDYFRDYLFDILKIKSEIAVNDHNQKIENFEIKDTCERIERMPPNEDFEENIIIFSTIKIHYTEAGKKKQQVVIAKTTLADETTRDITGTSFEPELI